MTGLPYPTDVCPHCGRPPGVEPDGCPVFVPGDRVASFARELDLAHRYDMRAAARAATSGLMIERAWDNWRKLTRDDAAPLTRRLPIAHEFRAVDALLGFFDRCGRG